MRRIIVCASMVFGATCAIASPAPEYVRITTEYFLPGSVRTQPKAQLLVAMGEKFDMTIGGDRTKPGLMLTLKPTLGDDNTITLETGISINRMHDTSAPTFDKRQMQITVRAKLGETNSIETADGTTYKWSATKLPDAEPGVLREKLAEK